MHHNCVVVSADFDILAEGGAAPPPALPEDADDDGEEPPAEARLFAQVLCRTCTDRRGTTE